MKKSRSGNGYHRGPLTNTLDKNIHRIKAEMQSADLFHHKACTVCMRHNGTTAAMD